MKKYFLILILFQSLSCINNDDVKYIKQVDGKSHLIDLGNFSVIVPNDFKYKKVQGIDSFVGNITNGKEYFYFDYGWYSPSPPLTKKQFINDKSENVAFDSALIFFNLINLKPYKEENGGVNPNEITKKIKNCILRKMNDTIVLSINKDTYCEYFYSFEFDGKDYNIPFYFPQENLDIFKNYNIQIDTIQNYQRTISIWKNKKNRKHSSVNLTPINTNSNGMKLWFGLDPESDMNVKELRKILESVKIEDVELLRS